MVNPISTLIIARARPGEPRLDATDERTSQHAEIAANEAIYEAMYGHGEWVHECPGCGEFTAASTSLCATCLALEDWC